MLTQKRFKDIFAVNLDTGICTYKISRGGKKAGSIADCKNNEGYIHVMIDGTRYKLHRLMFLYVNGSFPEHEVDHINGIRNDNRWTNLREVTKEENLKNKSMYKNNTSGTVGVVWYKASSVWRANIRVGGVLKHLGSFKTLEEATQARKQAEIQYGFHSNHGQIRPL